MKLAPLVILVALQVPSADLAAQRKDLYDITKVRTVELIFQQPDYWTQLSNNWRAKIYIKADLKIDGDTYKDVGVRFRGNSSYWGIPASSKKRAFKVALDEFQEQKLWGHKTLNINNNFMDPTMTREVFGYEIMRKFTPAPRSNYVVLKINGLNWGPYINTEQINKDLLEDWFPTEDGNRYRGERQASNNPANYTGFNWYGNNVDEYKKGFELKTEQNPNPWVDLIKACDVLNNTPAAQLPTELPKVFDVENVLTVLALGNTMLWLDSYVGRWCHNIYVYHDDYHGRFSLLPWDMNNCFGGYTDYNSQTSLPNLTPYYAYLRSGNLRPLMTKPLAHTPWKERFAAKVRRIKDELNWPAARARINVLQNLIDAEVQRDPHRLYSVAGFRGNVTTAYRLSWFSTISSLQSMIDGRHRYLTNHADIRRTAVTVSQLRHTPVRPTRTNKVWVTARAPGAASVLLHWRVRGPFIQAAMYDDGQHMDGGANDGVWGGSIVAQPAGTQVEYWVGAATTAGVWTGWINYGNGYQRPNYRVTWPTRSSPIRINELLAQNASGIKDEKGEREDWVELVNTGTQAVDLAGMHLSDDLGNSKKWPFPANTVIQPGKTILVWADEDSKDGKLHANFKLSGSGEEVALFDATGSYILDYVEFGDQFDDISTGRVIDGRIPWVTFVVPTPEAVNFPASCGTRTYSALDPTAHQITFGLAGSPKIASAPTLQLRNGVPNSMFFTLLTAGPFSVPLANDVVLLVSPPILGLLLIPSNGSGSADVPFPIPDDTNLVGLRLYLQTVGIDTSGFLGSNALEMTFCPK